MGIEIMPKSENLIPYTSRSADELRQMRINGGIKSGELRRAKKTMKEMLDYLLDKEIKTNKGDMSTMEAIMVSMIAKASKGDVRATEFIRDTIGQKPTEKREFVGELPPLVVRELKTNDKSNGDSDTVSAADNETLSE
jgi:hypothetical protein